jgi:uncharacterized membrane protein YeaQ/YmgE (transglycosylase-associated protein family)
MFASVTSAAIAALTSDSPLFTINIGDFHWTVTVGTVIYLAIAAITGLLAEFIVGWRLPGGLIGAVIAGLIGIWLFTHVFPFTISGDPTVYGVPIFRALIGAILLVFLWHLITFGAWRHRRPYYRRGD